MKILLAGPGTGKTAKIKKIINLDYKECKNILVLSFTNATVKDLKTKFSDCKNITCMTLHSFALKYNHLPELHILIKEEEDIIVWLANRIEVDFETFCEMLKCITFKSMIVKCLLFIKNNPVYFLDKLGKLDLLIVDEFQDFNPIEQDFIMQLAKLSNDSIILGDDDQSIYSFKDADPDGIITLYNDKNINKLYHENLCYRCPDAVIDYSSKLIQINKNRISKEWKKFNKKGLVQINQFLSQEESNNYIYNRILKIRENDPIASILILSPVIFAIDALKKILKENNIEFIDFWSDSLDNNLLFEVWWLNSFYNDNKFIFLVFLLKYYRIFTKKKFLEYFKEVIEKKFEPNTIIKEIIEMKYLPEDLSSYIIIKPDFEILINNHPEFEKFREHLDLNNLNKSVKDLIKKLKKTKDFIDGQINIMSIHKSKGLESDYVLINGLVSGILPNETKGIDTIEAQRRLLYVGMTRTKKELDLISTVEWSGQEAHKVDFKQFSFDYRKRNYKAKTSKFIDEINK